LLDDGAIELAVVSKKGNEISCRVVNSGTLGNKKGVNMPGTTVALPAMSDKDREDIRWGIKNDIDFIAASFVRKAQDVKDIRSYVATLMNEFHPPHHPHPRVISKIESTEALENFNEILEESDAIMVARGDLGVEIPMQTLCNVQKDIVRASNEAGRPVIVATQMLESMQKNPRPTRAECTDVANAVFDGADCVMLSGESAKGKYPHQSVAMMNAIVIEAEQRGQENDVSSCVEAQPGDSVDSISTAAVEAAAAMDASCIIVMSLEGNLAENVSKFRPSVPIVSVLADEKIGRLQLLHRGVHPVVINKAHVGNTSEAIRSAVEMGFCSKGNHVVLVSQEGTSTMLKIATV